MDYVVAKLENGKLEYITNIDWSNGYPTAQFKSGVTARKFDLLTAYWSTDLCNTRYEKMFIIAVVPYKAFENKKEV